MPLKKALSLFSFLLIAVCGFTQSATPVYNNDKNAAKKQRMNQMMKMEEEGDLIYNKYGVFGFKLSTNGYGIFYEKGKFINNRKSRILTFELNEVKDPKDHKETVTGDGYSYNYVSVGRLNNMYELKASIGQQHLLGSKGNKNGVAVTYLYSAGLSLGMLKQYQLDVYPYPPPDNQTIKSSYPTIFDSAYQVYDAVGLAGGWNHLQFTPGLNARAAMRFDFGRYNSSITAFEAGATAEYYINDMPLMAYIPAKKLFFSAYISIMFGKRK